jgi:beta-glucosidase
MTRPFRDPSASFAERADDLLAALTGDEKIAMLHQYSPPVPRLGLAGFCTGTECLHGASWRDHQGTGAVLPATVFPQPTGLAASWDPDLVRQVGRATGREIRALHDQTLHDQRPQISLHVWGPVVNLLRDPRWGRNEEGYSEDPLLTASMGTAFCAGLAGDLTNGHLLTAPTLKHFLGYNNEDYRDLTSSSLRPRVLHEYDLPPFREPIAAGVATGVMPSYNLVNGCPAHVSPLLRLIREWTGEELLTCSDAWAPSNLVDTQHYFDDHPRAHAAALRAGLDSFTDKDGDGTFTFGAVRAALDRGLISMADVDRAVRRKLLIRLRLGEFDPDGGPYAAAGVIDTPGHRELARTAALRSVVLLKNDGALPIAAGRIAVVGPLAATLYEDWYGPALPYQVTIADGLRATAVHDGSDRVRTDLGEFDVTDWGEDVVTLRQDGAYLTVTPDGALAVAADKPHGWVVRETFHRTPLPDGVMLLTSTATGRSVRLRWDVLSDGAAAAASVAAGADVAVVVVGNDPVIGGREGKDRTTLALPPAMDRLVRAVTAANPRTVLVVMSSYPYVLPDAPAIVWTCHAGQETGHAVADVLTGRHEPRGRLPQTWPAADADLPDPLDYDIITAGWTYQYATSRPAYPFGHGLTYTTFRYGPLSLAGSSASVEVTNTGDRSGTEVVQLYAGYGAPDRPRRRLCGWARLTLSPGQTQTAVIDLPDSALALWDVAAARMIVPPGAITIGAGASSEDIRSYATLTVPGAASARAGRVYAADFDRCENIALTDVALTDGVAVTPADPARRGWLMFRSFAAEQAVVSCFRVSCAAPGGGVIEVWHELPAGDALLDEVTVPCTGGRYEWTKVPASCSAHYRAGDLRLVLRGPVRLEWFE